MDSDLVHSAGEWPTQNHARRSVEVHSLKLSPALLPGGGHLADPDLVAHHLHRLTALSPTTEN